jgi:pimeloyl-ACP methyl ester carboxylesterase
MDRRQASGQGLKMAGGINRRDFAAITTAAFLASRARLSGQSSPDPLDIAEYSYFYVGVEKAALARGTICNGMQMYVEYWIPAQSKHPFPIVLIHGGGGQGTDWLSTPDGRRGWATYLLEEGYTVYIVDRPGQGRPPYHPDLNGYFEPQAWTYEKAAQEYTGSPQWPATTDAVMDQVVGPLGPAMANVTNTQHVWRTRGAMLLDQIGPAILVTHGDSSAFAWLTADERPALVKSIVAIEPTPPSFANQGFFGGPGWGLTKAPITFDPPVKSPTEITVVEKDGGILQEEPAHRLKNLAGIPIAIVTTASRDAGIVAFMQQAGCKVEQIKLAGSGRYMMMEKNNREALKPILDWIDLQPIVLGGPHHTSPTGEDSTAVKLSDQGCFWVGVQRKKMTYGTIPFGQMYVQYMIPAEKKYPYPIVMVHGGGGQGTHMMGIGKRPGWVQYFVQEGYAVYWVDRPGFGRSPYHPDALGPSYLRNFPEYENLITSIAVFNTAQWPGPGGMNDPLIDQFMANEVGRVGDEAAHSEVTAFGGAQLLDKIGPSILLTTAFGGFFGWVVADKRPNLVKGIMCMEGNGIPFAGAFKWGLTASPVTYDPPVKDPSQLKLMDTTLPADSPLPIVPSYKIQAEPARKLKNLQGIPIAWLTGEFGGGGNGIAQVNFLKQAGCDAELIRLRDLGIIGNGNLMQMEKNNHQVFLIIRDWFDKRVAKPGPA